MQELIKEFVEHYGYIAIAVSLCVENIFPPIPSEVVLGFGGFMTTYTRLTIGMTVFAATIGTTAGALSLYSIGRLLPKERILSLFSGRLGRVLRLRPSDIQKAEEWFIKYEYKAVFLCRFIPIVRSLVSIPAGISGMKILPFLTLTVIGTGIWNTVLIWLGARAGEAWEASLADFSLYFKVFLIAAAVMTAAGFILYRKRKKKNNQRK